MRRRSLSSGLSIECSRLVPDIPEEKGDGLSVISETIAGESQRRYSDPEITDDGRRQSVSPFRIMTNSRPIGKLFIQVHGAAELPKNVLCHCVVHLFGRYGKKKLFQTDMNENRDENAPRWEINNSSSFPLDAANEFFLRISIMEADPIGTRGKLARLFIPLNSLRAQRSGWFDLETVEGVKEDPTLCPRILLTVVVSHLDWKIVDMLHKPFHNCMESSMFQYVSKDMEGVCCTVPGDSESVEIFMEDFAVAQSGRICLGSLVFTNWRIVFLHFEKQNGIATLDKQLSFSIPYHSVLQIEIDHSKKVYWKPLEASSSLNSPSSSTQDQESILSLEVTTKAFRKIRLLFAGKFRENRKNLLGVLHKILERKVKRSNSPLSMLIYEQVRPNSERNLLSKPYSIEDEFILQGVTRKLFHKSVLNSTFALCDSYPSILYFPSSVEESVILGSAQFRSKGRLPALTYYSDEYGCCIARSSQPSAGLTGKTCEYDEALIDAFRRISPFENPQFVIFDARSVFAAEGNRFKGKGVEESSRYSNSKIIFLDIANIHTMRSSIDKLSELCLSSENTESNWYSSLEGTKWIWHLRSVLSGAVQITEFISKRNISALVHCSDGWDRTSQLCALTQIMLDPRYRTISGFMALIEKDFSWFGHKFHERFGLCEDKPNERSPVLLQFFDGVFQIMKQFPTAFEFSDQLLIYLLDMINSEWFGTFLFNNDFERSHNRTANRTLSIWGFLRSVSADFQNPFYKEITSVIIPITSVKRLEFWSNMYLRYDSTVFQASDHMNSEIGTWITEHADTDCADCQSRFSFLRRKYVCQQCGKNFCHQCIQKVKSKIPGGKLMKTCSSCSEQEY